MSASSTPVKKTAGTPAKKTGTPAKKTSTPTKKTTPAAKKSAGDDSALAQNATHQAALKEVEELKAASKAEKNMLVQIVALLKAAGAAVNNQHEEKATAFLGKANQLIEVVTTKEQREMIAKTKATLTNDESGAWKKILGEPTRAQEIEYDEEEEQVPELEDEDEDEELPPEIEDEEDEVHPVPKKLKIK